MTQPALVEETSVDYQALLETIAADLAAAIDGAPSPVVAGYLRQAAACVVSVRERAPHPPSFDYGEAGHVPVPNDQ